MLQTWEINSKQCRHCIFYIFCTIKYLSIVFSNTYSCSGFYELKQFIVSISQQYIIKAPWKADNKIFILSISKMFCPSLVMFRIQRPEAKQWRSRWVGSLSGSSLFENSTIFNSSASGTCWSCCCLLLADETDCFAVSRCKLVFRTVCKGCWQISYQ